MYVLFETTPRPHQFLSIQHMMSPEPIESRREDSKRRHYDFECRTIAGTHEDEDSAGLLCGDFTIESLIETIETVDEHVPHPPSGPHVDTVFSRAKWNRVILPDPLSLSDYFPVGQHGGMSRQLAIFSPVMRYLAKSEDLNSLCTLRLVSRQFYFMATYSLQTYSFKALSDPSEFDVVSIPQQSVNIRPPALPNAPFVRAECAYAKDTSLQLIEADTFSHSAVSTFRIMDQVIVKGGSAIQSVRGALERGDVIEHTTAYIFDPLYVDFSECPGPGNAAGEERPLQALPRRLAAYLAFKKFLDPLKIICDLAQTGHVPSLVPQPRVFRLFFPERELASERAAAVVVWEPYPSTSLSDVSKSFSPDDISHLTKAVATLYVQLLAYGGYFPDFLSCIGITQDGNVVLQSMGRFGLWDESNRYDIKSELSVLLEYVAEELRQLDWSDFSLEQPFMTAEELELITVAQLPL
jgi:hypothetical protein